MGRDVYDKLIQTFNVFIKEILGLIEEKGDNQDELLKVIIDLYSNAKSARDYQKVDEIRAALKGVGVIIKDMKNSVDWAYEE
ncbi:Cysteinyl-tRNA synthetase [Cyclobacterium qasimii M12-11B]|uniref:Cysteinyl-tRNA synthetase n=1 Tax=Cyclobacterium qasimii M12-11B TaxID=641524 RepID=S7VI35_9BACT|nr:Cysteinyl-tRNA synthetase [Cyclobacterium qasimii M12-11B]